MSKFNFVEGTRALLREVENTTDLQRSKDIVLSINERIGK